MDVFELLGVAGQVAASFQTSPEGTPGRVWQELSPWLTRLARSATTRWLPGLVAGTTCEVPELAGGRAHPCRRSAVCRCDVCGRPVCLAHGRFDHRAEGICFVCVAAALRAKASPDGRRFFEGPSGAHGYTEERPSGSGPDPATAARARAAALKDAYRTLGVSARASDEDVKKRYRALAKKWHPDTQPEAKKAEATAEFQRIGAAFERVMKERHPEPPPVP